MPCEREIGGKSRPSARPKISIMQTTVRRVETGAIAGSCRGVVRKRSRIVGQAVANLLDASFITGAESLLGARCGKDAPERSPAAPPWHEIVRGPTAYSPGRYRPSRRGRRRFAAATQSFENERERDDRGQKSAARRPGRTLDEGPHGGKAQKTRKTGKVSWALRLSRAAPEVAAKHAPHVCIRATSLRRPPDARHRLFQLA